MASDRDEANDSSWEGYFGKPASNRTGGQSPPDQMANSPAGNERTPSPSGSGQNASPAGRNIQALLAATRKAASTLLFHDPIESETESAPAVAVEPDEVPSWIEEKLEPVPDLQLLLTQTKAAARTLLDHQVLKAVVSRQQIDQEHKVRELQAQPQKQVERVDNYRVASPCSATWDNELSQEKVKICSDCQLYVYDFCNLDKNQAEELVCKQENLEKITLFRRKDGKFISRDCPVGLKRRLRELTRKICLTSAGFVLLVMVAISFIPHGKDSSPEKSALLDSQSSSPVRAVVRAGAARSMRGKTKTKSQWVTPLLTTGLYTVPPPEQPQSSDYYYSSVSDPFPTDDNFYATGYRTGAEPPPEQPQSAPGQSGSAPGATRQAAGGEQDDKSYVHNYK